MKTGKIRSWHSPHNEECAQNNDVSKDCTCKRQRKNYRVIRVRAKDVNHGVNPNIVIEVHPDGRLVFREARRPRKTAMETTTGEVYAQLVRQAALRALQKKNAERRERKKARKLARKLEQQQQKGK